MEIGKNNPEELLDLIPLPVFIETAKGECAYCNKAFGELLSTPPENLLGLVIRDFLKIDYFLGEFDKNRHKDGKPIFFYIRDEKKTGLLYERKFTQAYGLVEGWFNILVNIDDIQNEFTSLYQKVVEDQSELISRWRPNGILTFVNDAYCRFFGKPRKELINLPFKALSYPDDVALVTDYMRKIEQLTPQSPVASNEHRVMTSKGEVRWLQWSDRAIFNQNGIIVEYQSVGRDITEQKLIEETLRESEHRFRTIADFTYDWEYWVGSDGKLLYTSPSCERITGRKAEEFLKNPDLIQKIIHPDDNIRMSRHFSQEASNQDLREIEFRIFTRNGDLRWIGHRCLAVRDENGNNFGRRVSNRDITDRKNMEFLLQVQRNLAVSLSTIRDQNEALDRIICATVQVAPIDSGALYILDEPKNILKLATHRGLLREFLSMASHYNLGSPSTEYIKSGKPIYGKFSDIEDDYNKRKLAERESLKVVALIPVFSKGKLVASLFVASHTHSSIPSPCRNILEAIALQIGDIIAQYIDPR